MSELPTALLPLLALPLLLAAAGRSQTPPSPSAPEDDGRKPGHGVLRPPSSARAEPPAAATAVTATRDGSPAFVDGAAATGLEFNHVNGMTGELLFGEIMGAGGAFLDFDGDGDLDVFLVQGGPLAPAVGDGGGDGDARAPPRGDRLFKNLLAESGELRFVDVTETAGVGGTGYGMGAATGDVDGDGDVDLYVTNLGSNVLWRNDGDGTFSDVTTAARADDPRWSTAATFFDADLDGNLDLFVANYVAWTADHRSRCTATAGYRDYCGPLNYPPVADRLLENRGDGTFINVTLPAGIRATYGAALGALAHDLVAGDPTDDPRPEIYVANDAFANQLWCPGDGGAYADRALERGCALDARGRPEGSMGIDLGDVDEDGDLDLFVTHVHHETNTLYAADGDGGFADVTAAAGLAAPSLGMTGFGTGFLDYDNDGWLDLLVVNGAVTLIPEQAEAGDRHPLHQPNQLLRNLGRGAGQKGGEPPPRFADVSATAGPVFQLSSVSRGAAFGDVDDDGDTDVLVTNNVGPARLLLNTLSERGEPRPHWLGLRLLWTEGGRDDHGARATVELPDGRRLLRRVRLDGSYLSAHDPRLLVGLGETEAVEAVTVRWADGTSERFPMTGEPVDRYVTLVRGTAPRPDDAAAENGGGDGSGNDDGNGGGG